MAVSTSQSLYKASLAKSLLVAVEELDEDARTRVLSNVAPEHLRAIRDAPRTSWLEAEHQIAVDGAIAEVLGDDVLEGMIRKYVNSASDAPLFKPLVRGAIALFGLTPASIYRILPRAWGMSSRNAGVVTDRGIDEHTHEVSYSGMPPVMCVHSMGVTTRGSMLGILDLVECEGSVETDVGRLADGSVTHRISWRRR